MSPLNPGLCPWQAWLPAQLSLHNGRTLGLSIPAAAHRDPAKGSLVLSAAQFAPGPTPPQLSEWGAQTWPPRLPGPRAESPGLSASLRMMTLVHSLLWKPQLFYF